MVTGGRGLGSVDAGTAMVMTRMTAFHIAAILVCLTCLVYVGLRRRFDKLQNKLFIAIVIDVVVSAISDLAAELVRMFAEGAAASVAVEVAGYVYFVAHTAMAPLFMIYVFVVCRDSGGRPLRNKLMAIPFFVAEFIALTNPLTHWMYVYGPGMEYTRNWAMYPVYAVGVFYLVMGFLQLVRSWRALTVLKRRGLIYFFAMAGAGVVVQLLVPSFCVELFAESIAVLGVMMFVENEDALIDLDAGVYNRHALEADLDMYTKGGSTCNIVAVHVMNIDSYLHNGGSTMAAQAITSALSGYFKEIMPWYNVYRASTARYVLINPDLNSDDARAVADRIAERFKMNWTFLDASIDLHAIVAHVRIPEDLTTAEDVLHLIDTPIPSPAKKDVLTGDDLDYLVRQAEIERAIQRGFEEGEYEVYYQPICDVDGKPRSAEALMRLHDRVLGEVPPFEFIQVAEHMGLVDEIGELALRDVCAFFASGIPQKYGIAHISVNLSVIQCMQANFSVHADEIIDSYGIDPNLVSFEITESVAAGNYEFLGKVMGQLKQGGHRFAMDDYGTGYSNMHSLVALDFDVVKIDKSVLWDAEKSELGLVILQNGVNLMRNIGCEVLVEGVETARQVDLLHALNVDYYQGYYYAKPMSKDAFVSFLEERRG